VWHPPHILYAYAGGRARDGGRFDYACGDGRFDHSCHCVSLSADSGSSTSQPTVAVYTENKKAPASDEYLSINDDENDERVQLEASESGNRSMAFVTATSPGDWTYVSEGRNNIVFSYTGPRHARFSGTVLRVRKTVRPGSANHGVLDSERDCTTIVAFQQNVITRLIPSTHLPRLEVVQLGEGWLEALAARWDEMRPTERRKIDRIDVSATDAIQATDLVGNGVLVVEIKVLVPRLFSFCVM
jgi:hypothetical protein